MSLALFDLDNTLIAGDSDHSWGEFLVEQGIVDAVEYRRRNDEFYEAYQRRELDIMEYLEFAVQPLTQYSLPELKHLHDRFLAAKIAPIRLAKADELIAKHRVAGDKLLIITATNRFITEPIANWLGIPDILATDLEIANNAQGEPRYTGKIIGVPCYQTGKITHLEAWLADTGHDLRDSYFYSDSMNDLPLLEQVTYPHAVNPDDDLQAHAEAHGWPILDLRD